MKKASLISLLFVFLITLLVYNISQANIKIDNFFKLHQNIFTIISTNKNFKIFSSSAINYTNFDTIKDNVETLHRNIEEVKSNYLFSGLTEYGLKKEFLSLEKDLEKKIQKIESLKSNSAVLNNSYRVIKKTIKEIDNKAFISVYSDLVVLDHNPEVEYASIKDRVFRLKASTKYERLFILHSKIVLEKASRFSFLKDSIKDLDLLNKLDSFELKYRNYSKTIIDEVKYVIWFLILFLSIAIIGFLIYSYTLVKKQIELNRFRQAVETSDNIIIITDRDKNIKYVNQSFIDSSGYKQDEVIGKKPSLFKSGFITEDFYKNMNKTIFSGKKWTGEFINRNKEGNLTYERATITPILNDKGEIEEFLAIKLDITNEKHTQKMLKDKDHLLAQQSKMIAMREMLESIAHQWRQPLSTISTAASGLRLNKEFNTLTDESFEELSNAIVDNTLYLSKTIDNFKSFFKTNNEKTVFDIKESFDKVFEIVGYKIENHNIEYVLNIESIFIEGLENDLIQAFVNIINNAQDVLNKNNKDKKIIFIDVTVENKSVMIRIKDNASGIKEDILEHVLEPYFTTKHESQGTGIGLYMTHEIITKHFLGKIELSNKRFRYKNDIYKGVEVLITLPIHVNDLDEVRPTFN